MTAAAAMFGGAVSTASADIVIDDFSATSVAWPLVQDTIGSSSVDESGQGGVLGGVRQTTLEATSLAALGLDSIAAIVAPTYGVLDFQSSAGADGALSLFYEGATGDLDVDLSGDIGVRLDFALFDHANGQDLSITITLDDGSATAVGSALLAAPGPQSALVAFDDFSGIDLVNLASIDSIRFDLDSGLGGDFRLNEIRTVVPAPGALGVLALAAIAGPRRRRRRG